MQETSLRTCSTKSSDLSRRNLLPCPAKLPGVDPYSICSVPTGRGVAEVLGTILITRLAPKSPIDSISYPLPPTMPPGPFKEPSCSSVFSRIVLIISLPTRVASGKRGAKYAWICSKRSLYEEKSPNETHSDQPYTFRPTMGKLR